MLYVSRYIRSDSYGIVDTDDDVEEVVTQTELLNLVTDYGMKFAGVSTYTAEFPFGTVDYVDKVNIYQDPRYITPLQTKAILLWHVNVTLYKSSITRISWNPDDIEKIVSIRLSDFGDSVCDRVLVGNKWSKLPAVRLIVDDKVQVTDKSFDAGVYGSYEYGVRFDLSELSDDYTAKMIYKSVLGPDRNRQGFNYIIDSEERKLEMRMSL